MRGNASWNMHIAFYVKYIMYQKTKCKQTCTYVFLCFAFFSHGMKVWAWELPPSLILVHSVNVKSFKLKKQYLDLWYDSEERVWMFVYLLRELFDHELVNLNCLSLERMIRSWNSISLLKINNHPSFSSWTCTTFIVV